MIKIGVIFGGPTVEHEVSIISAVQAMNNLDKEKYDIYPIYIDKNSNWYTGNMLMEMDIYRDFDNLKRYAKRVVLYNKDGKYLLQSVTGFKKVITELDIVLPVVHGNNIEDGTIQGYLNTVGIPYVGSSVLGSSLGQDKVVMKQVFQSVGLPIVPYIWFFDYQYYETKDAICKDVNKLGYPVLVKPATLGSSVGITYVHSEEDLNKAITEAINYDKKIIIEKAVNNLVEVNCSVLGNYENQQASVLEEVMSTKEFLTYQDKYVGGKNGKLKGSKPSKGMAGASRIVPARLDEEMTLKIQNLAKDAFLSLNLSGVCRIDFLVDSKSNKVYINEPNTIPGSLAFYLWEESGKKYPELLDEMITIAIKDYKDKAKKTTVFETNILSNFSGVKGAKGLKGKLR